MVPFSCATLFASVIADILLGCVTPIIPLSEYPASYRNCGICVVLPDPEKQNYSFTAGFVEKLHIECKKQNPAIESSWITQLLTSLSHQNKSLVHIKILNEAKNKEKYRIKEIEHK